MRGLFFLWASFTAMPFDFAHVTSPFRMQPGLRRLPDGAVQLTPNLRTSRAMREKVAVLAAFRDQALLVRPGFDAAPALRVLCEHAHREHPQAFEFTADGFAAAKHLGWSLRDGELVADADAETDVAPSLSTLPPPWRLPALLSLAFAEDFAILDAGDGSVPWMAVCLPSSWAPETKIGRHFAEIHAPVADNATLLAASDHLTRLVTGSQRWERFVWTITRHPRLHAHPDRVDPAPWPAELDADAIAARAYFRSERQTFIPVPGHGQAVFTIRVDVQPLAEAVTRAGDARALHDALSTMSDAVLQYRGLTEVRARLLEWLQARIADGR